MYRDEIETLKVQVLDSCMYTVESLKYMYMYVVCHRVHVWRSWKLMYASTDRKPKTQSISARELQSVTYSVYTPICVQLLLYVFWTYH